MICYHYYFVMLSIEKCVLIQIQQGTNEKVKGLEVLIDKKIAMGL